MENWHNNERKPWQSIRSNLVTSVVLQPMRLAAWEVGWADGKTRVSQPSHIPSCSTEPRCLPAESLVSLGVSFPIPAAFYTSSHAIINYCKSSQCLRAAQWKCNSSSCTFYKVVYIEKCRHKRKHRTVQINEQWLCYWRLFPYGAFSWYNLLQECEITITLRDEMNPISKLKKTKKTKSR